MEPVVARFFSDLSRFLLAVLTATCFIALPLVQAYEAPLTPAAVHEAYVLGRRNDQATAEFFAPYMKQPTAGTEHPDIAQIEIRTPFAQVVDSSRQNATTNYTEQAALEDYHRDGDKIVVQVTLVLPAAYTKAAQNSAEGNPPNQENKNVMIRPENFWQNFRISLKQRDKLIPSRAIRNRPVYSAATKDTPSVLDGAIVWLEYDAKDVASEEAVVEVLTPAPKTITATFDLKNLR